MAPAGRITRHAFILPGHLLGRWVAYGQSRMLSPPKSTAMIDLWRRLAMIVKHEESVDPSKRRVLTRNNLQTGTHNNLLCALGGCGRSRRGNKTAAVASSALVASHRRCSPADEVRMSGVSGPGVKDRGRDERLLPGSAARAGEAFRAAAGAAACRSCAGLSH